MADVFSVLAGIFMIASVSMYLVKLFSGATTANPVTWGIAAIAMTLNNLTYFTIVSGRLKENVPGLLVNVVIIIILVKSLFGGKPVVVLGDIAVFLLAVIIGAVWRITGNAFIANVALQSALLLSFWPTFNGLMRGRLRDHPVPWIFAVASYSFQILTIVTNRSDWTWHALVFPIVNGILGNGSIAVAAWRSDIRIRTASAESIAA